MELTELLRRLEEEGGAHDAAQAEHRHKRLNLERPTATLLQFLLLTGRRRRVLEIGTSNGYSALWIADALRRTPEAEPLITIERDARKAEEAQRNLRAAGLERWVDLRVGEATQVVAGLNGHFDAVFFDADRVSAPEQLRILLPMLAQDVLLMADNALSHPEEIAGYIETVKNLPGFLAATIPVGKGLHLAYRMARS